MDDSYGNIRKCIKDIKSKIKNLEIMIADLPSDENIIKVPEINNDTKKESNKSQETSVIDSLSIKKEEVKTNVIKSEFNNDTQNKPIKSEGHSVTLTVSGTGKTIEEARLNALRSAIEQAFGAFISSKTEILNDNLVKDEIVSIANGNVQKYDVVSQVELPNVGYAITLSATVSIDKLTTFAESKGIVVEFKGGIFAQNIKLQKLNENAELIVIKNFCITSFSILMNSIDYKIFNSEPYVIGNGDYDFNWKYDTKNGLYLRKYNKDDYKINFSIEAKSNNNLNIFYENLAKLITSLNMSTLDIINYKKLNKEIVEVEYNKSKYYLRNIESAKALHTLFIKAYAIPTFFKIESNVESYNNILSVNAREIEKSYNFIGSLLYKDELFSDRKVDYSISGMKAVETYISEFKDLDNDFNNFRYDNELYYYKVDCINIESKEFYHVFPISRFFTLQEIEKIDAFKILKINLFEDLTREIVRQKKIEYIVLKGIEENEITNINGEKYVSDMFADPLQEFLENNLFTFEIIEKNKDYYIVKTNNNKLLKLKYPPKYPYKGF
ncbi:MAG: hypothetical protein NT048_00560 [Flavobacterium sp.]|nr:hypothetical protein [Flavobacterium sp.]